MLSQIPPLLTSVISVRINSVIESYLSETQLGFSNGKSAIDKMFLPSNFCERIFKKKRNVYLERVINRWVKFNPGLNKHYSSYGWFACDVIKIQTSKLRTLRSCMWLNYVFWLPLTRFHTKFHCFYSLVSEISQGFH